MSSEPTQEAQKPEKPKINNAVKHVPKDAQVIKSIFKELGVDDYEPRVINQLLDFTYRYVTCILDDAKAFANHAKKKVIDLDDVKLATEMILDKSFTTPPPRQVLSKLAEVRNSMPLPLIKPHCGIRLPPDRYCLTACNYRLKGAIQPKKLVKTSLESRSVIKTQLKPQASSSIKRQQLTKNQIVSIPKPVFKFSSTQKAIPANKQQIISGIEIKEEIDKDNMGGSSGIKREREDDEFEVVN